MNVHRRDRARLRQSPPMDQTFYHHQDNNSNSQDQASAADGDDYPILTLNPNPNPSLNFAAAAPTSTTSSFVSSFLSPSSSSLGKTVSCFRPEIAKSKPLRIDEPPPPPPVAARSFDEEIDLCSFNSTVSTSAIRMGSSSMLGMDLQLGDSSTENHHPNSIDLELRLGRS